jgi:hypothetical protein
LESANELLGFLPAANDATQTRLLWALSSLDILQKEQRTTINAAVNREVDRMAVARETEDYLVAAAKVTSLQKQVSTMAANIATLELATPATLQSSISADDPTEPDNYTPPPPMRKRDSLVFGGGAGLALAWLAAGFIDFRRNGRHQPPAPRRAGRVRGWLAGLGRRKSATQQSSLVSPGAAQKSPPKGKS